MGSTGRIWWKDSTVYQIWPASYKDSDGDGIGDIGGIIQTLDYLKDFGIDIIWVSPMYDSPQEDMGYDVSNYEEIYSRYGSVADAEKLIEECHNRDMRIVFDLVINHTSHQHAWFKESRSSKDNPKRGWYIWYPAKYNEAGQRRPPNNWRAHFGGSAWEWDDTTQEYYLHLFAPGQPDLNWENSVTRNAIYDSAIKFWLDKGIDGYRIDTVNMYSKTFPSDDPSDGHIDGPPPELQFCPQYFINGPRMHEFLREMYDEVLSKYDCMTVGELPHTHDPAHVLRYVGAKEKQLNMVFQFDVVDLGQGEDCRYDSKPFKLAVFKETIARLQSLVIGNDGWTTSFLENHDQGRSISRFGSDLPEYRTASGKLLAIMLTTLTGTLYLYQGQEIGMINMPRTWTATDFKDIEAVNHVKHIRSTHPGDESALKKAEQGIVRVGRDNARTPVQWDSSKHAGFTTGKPWMRVHDSYREINVADQRKDPDSLLNFWKMMLKMRKQYIDLFAHGDFRMYDATGETTLTYTKEFEGEKILVLLNFTAKQQKMFVPEGLEKRVLLVSNAPIGMDGVLGPYEGRVYLVR